MDYLLLIGMLLCAWLFLRQLGNERETQVRLIEIRARRDADELVILKKIEEERESQRRMSQQ